MDIKKVGVVGCGLMGHGIAQVAAQAGYDVVVREVDQDRLDKGLAKVEKQIEELRRHQERERLAEEERGRREAIAADRA